QKVHARTHPAEKRRKEKRVQQPDNTAPDGATVSAESLKS
ncbi:TPA: recombinase XerD, partial [Escherichia coli]|nr:recombinase XerD [Escherichia coli]